MDNFLFYMLLVAFGLIVYCCCYCYCLKEDASCILIFRYAGQTCYSEYASNGKGGQRIDRSVGFGGDVVDIHPEEVVKIRWSNTPIKVF